MKKYFLKFGSGDPRTYTGLSPTFLIFEAAGVTLAPPAIAEDLTGSGIYSFQWGTTTSVAFLADAATTSPGTALRYITGSLDPADRADEYGTSLIALGTSAVALGTSAVALGTSNFALGTTAVALGSTNFGYGVSNFALGTTAVAIGTTLMGIGLSNVALGTSILNIIGTTASSFGDNVTDPSTLFGYMKRLAELEQGREAFNKGTGALTMLDRTGGTTFVQRTISNNASLVVKA